MDADFLSRRWIDEVRAQRFLNRASLFSDLTMFETWVTRKGRHRRWASVVRALLLPDREQVKFCGWWGRSAAEFLNARAFISPHALDSWRPSKLRSNSLSTRRWTLFPFPSFFLFFFCPCCSTQDASSSAWLKHHNPFGLRKLWNWQVIKISQCPKHQDRLFCVVPTWKPPNELFWEKKKVMQWRTTWQTDEPVALWFALWKTEFVHAIKAINGP